MRHEGKNLSAALGRAVIRSLLPGNGLTRCYVPLHTSHISHHTQTNKFYFAVSLVVFLLFFKSSLDICLFSQTAVRPKNRILHQTDDVIEYHSLRCVWCVDFKTKKSEYKRNIYMKARQNLNMFKKTKNECKTLLRRSMKVDESLT